MNEILTRDMIHYYIVFIDRKGYGYISTHDRLSTFTLEHNIKTRNNIFIAVLYIAFNIGIIKILLKLLLYTWTHSYSH